MRLFKSAAFVEDTLAPQAEKESNGNTGSLGHENIHQQPDQRPQQPRKAGSIDLSGSPKMTFLMRQASGTSHPINMEIVRRGDTPEIREHLRHLGPSNLASRPRETRYNNVKIKRRLSAAVSDSPLKDIEIVSTPLFTSPRPSIDGSLGVGLVQSAGRDASDGVHAVQVGYGTIDRPDSGRSTDLSKTPSTATPKLKKQGSNESARTTGSTRTDDTVRSLPRIKHATTMPSSSRTARSGSITENIVETGGFRKTVLETTSSSSEDGQTATTTTTEQDSAPSEQDMATKKQRRRKKKKAETAETEPLLEGNEARS